MKTFRIEATYAGQDGNGHHLLRNVSGSLHRDWYYVNGQRGNFPEGIPPGSRIRFFASPHYTRKGPRITDVRQVVVLE